MDRVIKLLFYFPIQSSRILGHINTANQIPRTWSSMPTWTWSWGNNRQARFCHLLMQSIESSRLCWHLVSRVFLYRRCLPSVMTQGKRFHHNTIPAECFLLPSSPLLLSHLFLPIIYFSLISLSPYHLLLSHLSLPIIYFSLLYSPLFSLHLLYFSLVSPAHSYFSLAHFPLSTFTSPSTSSLLSYSFTMSHFKHGYRF